MVTIRLLALPVRGLFTGPAAARPAAGIHRLGVISPGFPPGAATPNAGVAALRERLHQLGQSVLLRAGEVIR